MLEPLLQGCFVAYGPKIELLDEALKLDKRGLGQKINDEKDFLEFISKVNDVDFIQHNKARVSEIFKLKKQDFDEMQGMIFND